MTAWHSWVWLTGGVEVCVRVCVEVQEWGPVWLDVFVHVCLDILGRWVSWAWSSVWGRKVVGWFVGRAVKKKKKKKCVGEGGGLLFLPRPYRDSLEVLHLAALVFVCLSASIRFPRENGLCVLIRSSGRWVWHSQNQRGVVRLQRMTAGPVLADQAGLLNPPLWFLWTKKHLWT